MLPVGDVHHEALESQLKAVPIDPDVDHHRELTAVHPLPRHLVVGHHALVVKPGDELLPFDRLSTRAEYAKCRPSGRVRVRLAAPDLARAPLNSAESGVAEEVVGECDGLHRLMPVAHAGDARIAA